MEEVVCTRYFLRILCSPCLLRICTPCIPSTPSTPYGDGRAKYSYSVVRRYGARDTHLSLPLSLALESGAEPRKQRQQRSPAIASDHQRQELLPAPSRPAPTYLHLVPWTHTTADTPPASSLSPSALLRILRPANRGRRGDFSRCGAAHLGHARMANGMANGSVVVAVDSWAFPTLWVVL